MLLAVATPMSLTSYAPERAALDREFDNSVRPAVEKPLYDKIYEDLTAKLRLTDKQQRRLRDLIRGQSLRFDSVAAKYDGASLILKKRREELSSLRDSIKSVLDGVPRVVSEKLDSDQRPIYARMLSEEKSYKAETGQPVPEPAAQLPAAELPKPKKPSKPASDEPAE